MEVISLLDTQKHTARLCELLELGHVLDYLNSCSSDETRRSRPRSSSGASGGVSWAGLWRCVTVYVAKEIEAINKLEGKATGSTAAFTNRQTKKRVMPSLAHLLVMICGALPSAGCGYDCAGILQGRQQWYVLITQRISCVCGMLMSTVQLVTICLLMTFWIT